MITKEKIIETIQQYAPKEIIGGIVVDGAKIGFALESKDEELRKKCEKAVFAIPGVEKVTAVLTASTGKITVENKGSNALDRKQPIPGVKKVIAVAAGKGGVGKSTIAVNLAIAAAALGKKVGLVDADIYGPSVPKMLGLKGKPDLLDNLMIPHQKLGVVCNSIGFLIPEEDAAIWRGPMATKAIHQLFIGTKWDNYGELDVLFIDMPPGTGDIHLSIAQNYKVDGAVIVSTPQEIALADVRKAVKMFERVGTPIFGVIENMSHFIDPMSGNKTYIFGQGGAKAYAAEIKLPFLAEVPINPTLCHDMDIGEPSVNEVFTRIIAQIA